MNKAELVAAVDSALGEEVSSAQSEALVQQIVDTVVRTVVAGEKVSITGFGVFEPRQRAARKGRNPYSGDSIRIKATTIPKFRPSGQFKDLVAGRTKIARTGLATGRATPTAITAAPTSRTAARKKPATTSTKAGAAKAPTAIKATAKKAAVKEATPRKRAAR